MPTPAAGTLAEVLKPVTDDPRHAGIFLDVDGTLAPIVGRAEDAHVPEKTSRALAALARHYGCVACISGRAATEARRLVGVGGIAYAGSHGAELLEPGSSKPTVLPAFATWAPRVREFAAARDERDLRLLRIRIEDKGPIVALHWRGVPDEDAARTRLEGVAQEAEAEGLAIHWGRKVLEIRPPVEVHKGQAVTELVRRHDLTAALFAGDDATDLDAFDALDALPAAVRVGVRSDEGPAAIVERADLVVDGPEGFVAVLAALAPSP
ncbi:MAG: trehalose 6-phosphate phosphatase [Thermoleophilaceae bacterium]|nr:trehalose 6-phosphate phosphatase [Thermoleophilaceae bacterium]